MKIILCRYFELSVCSALKRTNATSGAGSGLAHQEQGLLPPSADQACRARVTIITLITWILFSENTREEEPCLTG